MKIADVPQDRGISEDVTVVSYAVAEDGRYVKVGSRGWEPVNVANGLAWEQVEQIICETVVEIENGTRSTLAYHMVVHQMDAALLAHYTGFFKWRVKRHLRPGVFGRLKPAVKEKYASLFHLSIAELEQVPPLPQRGMLL
jgi:hypothetical protein